MARKTLLLIPLFLFALPTFAHTVGVGDSQKSGFDLRPGFSLSHTYRFTSDRDSDNLFQRGKNDPMSFLFFHNSERFTLRDRMPGCDPPAPVPEIPTVWLFLLGTSLLVGAKALRKVPLQP